MFIRIFTLSRAKQLWSLSEVGRTVMDGFTFLKVTLADKSIEVIKCHTHTVEEEDSGTPNLDIM